MFIEIRQPIVDVPCDCDEVCGWQHLTTNGVPLRYYLNGLVRLPRPVGVPLARRLRRYRPEGVSLGW